MKYILQMRYLTFSLFVILNNEHRAVDINDSPSQTVYFDI